MIKNRGLAKMLKPLLVMVAGAKKVCVWKYGNQAIRRSSEYIISWASQKNEFSRGAMEKALDLTLGQSEWWVKELLKKGVIKRTSKNVPNIIGKGKPQKVYKYIGGNN